MIQVKKDTVIIIPAFNEQESVSLVLKDIPMERVIKVIVVDNNSTDNTAEVAKASGALVVKETRKGYGSACLKGISQSHSLEPEIIVFLDADYSDHPNELTLLLAEIDGGNDMVIGCRNMGKAQPGALLPQAIFGNWLASKLTYLFFGGFQYNDLGPFRAIKYNSLQSLDMQDVDFGWTIEMQVKALIHKLKISQISVSYRKRIGVSKITGTIRGTILAGKKILQTIFVLKWKSIMRKNH